MTKSELESKVKVLTKRVERLQSQYIKSNEILMDVLESVHPFIPVFSKALELEIQKKLDKHSTGQSS